ncbi:MAG: prepilin-type N-terminal cleavage/methylation domain-containing protein [Campylobacteraceae bacterium]|nr:prepilin-type N-terminal cleavage/methylation domain-containing protein [Campylobacteraceae bacterium]
MKKGAFTMIELILVIIIFGIIGTIGADIIATMYKNYIQARTINYLQSQSEITLQQIAKRLQYRIKDTAIAHKGAIDLLLSDSTVDNTYNVIQWIGYSNEALLTTAGQNPGWSGFIDLAAAGTNSAAKTLSTPGSNLAFAHNIISALTDSKVTLDNGNAALIFKGIPDTAVGAVEGYWGGWDPDYVVRVTRNGNSVFNIVGAVVPKTIYEQYYLAHTAYAIVPEGAGVNFTLTLRYNFQPWLGQTYEDGERAILADNVNLFRVRQTGSTIRLKLCLNDDQSSGAGDYIVTCKEEVVL